MGGYKYLHIIAMYTVLRCALDSDSDTDSCSGLDTDSFAAVATTAAAAVAKNNFNSNVPLIIHKH